MTIPWRPLLVAITVLLIVVVIVVLLVGGGDEPYETPSGGAPPPTVTLDPDELDGGEAKRPEDSEPVSAKDLEVGDCLAGATSTTGDVTTFDKVDCDKPHDGEVFTLIELESDRYPGTEFVRGKGQRGCRARLRRQVTAKALADRRLGYKFVYPTAQSWAQGDREVTCLATFTKPRTTKLQQRPGADS